MECGSSSGNNRSGLRKITIQQIVEMTKTTMDKIESSKPIRRTRSGTTLKFHDMTSKGYGWLLPGWVAEERRSAESGRVYRFYYDPNGCFYPTQKKVVKAMEQDWNVIVLDI
ncbi:hypothetical protein VNO78_06651 [Psophocarpus tetragonolobus]|uniref:MBD domain-containing protein n=1 Tax=Psophocarpus tetragonolobus TaxID=3891 RepID=A0AAN9STW9_PSOTE